MDLVVKHRFSWTVLRLAITGFEESEIDAVVRDESPIVLLGAELTDYAGNRLKWKLTAQKALIFENKKLTNLIAIDAEIPNADLSQLPTLIRADKGVIRGDSKLVFLTGSVVVDFSNGQRLFTEELTLDQKQEKLYNHSNVLVVSNHDTMRGTSMLYHLKTEQLTLTRPQMIFQLDAE